ncbi:MAG: hypothetical protein Q8M79_00385 [Dehalococcoidia bacterium]|nr:hypothetical protein [Dehalococcoidia bacterium]
MEGASRQPRTRSSGADSLTVAHFAESPLYSDAVVGAGIVAVWLMAFVGAAYLLLKRRDA